MSLPRPCVHTLVMRKIFVALALERHAHPVFSLAAMVFPAVIEEGDAMIDGFVDDLRSSSRVFRIAEMVTT